MPPARRRSGPPTNARRSASASSAGPKVARVEVARAIATAIWYMLTRNEPFAPAGPMQALVA